MRDFKLPLISGTTLVSNTFGPVIESKRSGVVVETESGFRLLHFSQLWAADQERVERVIAIRGYWDLGEKALGKTPENVPVTMDYWLAETDSDWATVGSQHEWQADMFMVQSPGFSCDAKAKDKALETHFYPPNKKNGKDCSVLGCPGEVP